MLYISPIKNPKIIMPNVSKMLKVPKEEKAKKTPLLKRKGVELEEVEVDEVPSIVEDSHEPDLKSIDNLGSAAPPVGGLGVEPPPTIFDLEIVPESESDEIVLPELIAKKPRKRATKAQMNALAAGRLKLNIDKKAAAENRLIERAQKLVESRGKKLVIQKEKVEPIVEVVEKVEPIVEVKKEPILKEREPIVNDVFKFAFKKAATNRRI